MKLSIKLGTTSTVNQNIAKAQKMLGEIGYRHFRPAAEYKVKNGFVAIRDMSLSLNPSVVVLRSRGSFLELRSDSTFYPIILSLLRKGLWVPICVGKPIDVKTGEDLSVFVSPEEHEVFRQLFPDARLS